MRRATYSVYNVKDDMPIIIAGTIAQCAAACGITVASFTAQASKQRNGVQNAGQTRKYVIIRDEPMEDEEE